MNDADKDNENYADTATGAGATANPGGDKVEPMSASPTSGRTIAGRDVHTGGTLDLTNRGEKFSEDIGGTHTGGPDTEGKGVTGQGGVSESSAHEGPEAAAQSE